MYQYTFQVVYELLNIFTLNHDIQNVILVYFILLRKCLQIVKCQYID